MPFGYHMENDNDMIEFRENIQLGDLVDVIKVENPHSKKCWTSKFFINSMINFNNCEILK
jgi:hypothetical protein